MKHLFYCIFFPLFSIAQIPDYSKLENWAALPTVVNNSMWTPQNSTLKNNQDQALVDVFFIHPTTDIYGFKISGNTDIDQERVNKQTDELCIKYQASVFNGSCKVYAPRYRQAVLHNFFARNSEKSQQAFAVAYADIKAAFEYYLKHYNYGRPIIIAGHSQGSMHAAHLLQEFFDGQPLQQQLVVAYVIGYPTYRNQFQYIPIANHKDSIGGIVSYNTFLLGTDGAFANGYKNAITINPLDWTDSNLFVDASKHLGGIQRNEETIFEHLLGAKCGDGILEIQKPNVKGYVPLLKNNYHVHDYSLFYMNIRENVAHRVALYFKQQSKE